MGCEKEEDKSNSIGDCCCNDEEDPLRCWLAAVKDIVNNDPPPDIPAPPVQVLPWLYLAPFHCVRDKASRLSKDLGITHVLSTNRMPPNILETLYWDLRSHDVDHYYVAADDLLTYDMMQHWEECRDFLQTCADGNGKALVHCSAGMNRSGTIAAACMMHFGKMDIVEIARTLKQKRGYVLSNDSFVEQLVDFAAKEGYLGNKPLRYL
mmetsp:Transcript_78314/g.227182  ORF Transcript_78314/g.227182 Transcript_78314/m.227182 type:complete len:208 (-) Transcript_78314:251-874(-)|eukprot:CAMPEP_0176023824 /NCGR_PEP_ID=MMETSP0120_2-20121206/11629_1 /TAXON_ID=160619 /ORGANISM="Kryptoperidinium foliaceum, Strain CCMP 1326" /LENGTH=207 /DNA_ID=CAMNT_0017356991 /DNA_START=88 /DNA_END=711 /DNA_ORIENTATION=-